MRYLIAANYLMQYCLLLVFLFTILYIFTHKYLKPKEQTFALFFFFCLTGAKNILLEYNHWWDMMGHGKKQITGGCKSNIRNENTWK